MSKYIKLDDVIENRTYCVIPMCSECRFYDEMRDKCDVKELLESLPTIDIVHCSECKNAFDAEGEIICNHLSGMAGLNVVVKADDFCSYGERIDDE